MCEDFLAVHVYTIVGVASDDGGLEMPGDAGRRCGAWHMAMLALLLNRRSGKGNPPSLMRLMDALERTVLRSDASMYEVSGVGPPPR